MLVVDSHFTNYELYFHQKQVVHIVFSELITHANIILKRSIVCLEGLFLASATSVNRF